MELISVIVPVYNIENYITRCVESILHQTYKNLQIILVNDGSTDNSGKVCDELALRDQRIEVYHKENGGLSSARNFGLEKARGSFVGFIDGDDYIEADMYSSLYSKGKPYDADIVSCGYYEEFDDRTNIMCYNEKITVFDRVNAYKALFSNNAVIGCSCCNKLFKTSVFSEKRFQDGIQSEDLEIMYRLLDVVNNVVCIDEIKYHYAHRFGSISMRPFSEKNMAAVEITEKMVAFIKDKYPEITPYAYAYQLKWLIGTINTIANSPNRKDMRKYKKVIDRVIKKNFKYYWTNFNVNFEYYVLFWANLFYMYRPARWVLVNGTRFYHFLRGNK